MWLSSLNALKNNQVYLMYESCTTTTKLQEVYESH